MNALLIDGGVASNFLVESHWTDFFLGSRRHITVGIATVGADSRSSAGIGFPSHGAIFAFGMGFGVNACLHTLFVGMNPGATLASAEP